jgi:hypothetical protein
MYVKKKIYGNPKKKKKKKKKVCVNVHFSVFCAPAHSSVFVRACMWLWMQFQKISNHDLGLVYKPVRSQHSHYLLIMTARAKAKRISKQEQNQVSQQLTQQGQDNANARQGRCAGVQVK